jgi:hypothetical protein
VLKERRGRAETVHAFFSPWSLESYAWALMVGAMRFMPLAQAICTGSVYGELS